MWWGLLGLDLSLNLSQIGHITCLVALSIVTMHAHQSLYIASDVLGDIISDNHAV